MEKQTIPREYGRLKWLCNEAYFAVRSIPLMDRINHKLLAFLLGGISGYGIASAGKYIINQTSLPLEEIASHSLAVTAGTPLVSYIVAPKNTREFVRENPTYSSGVLGVMTGASIKALEVLLF